MRVGLQHEHAVEFGVLLDLGAIDGKAVALRVGEEAAIALVANRLLSPCFNCRSRSATIFARLTASFFISSRLRQVPGLFDPGM